MIRHTVTFTLIHPAGSEAEQDFLMTARTVLSSLPGVRDFIINRQVSPKSDHTFQFSMDFADQAAYDAYDSHPEHQNFVTTRWQTEVATFQELDLSPLV